MRCFVLLLPLIPNFCQAQCVNGRCAPIPAAAPVYRWHHFACDANRVYLYDQNRQIGAYDLAEHYYRPFDGRVWGDRGEPPIPPPCFGVSAEKLNAEPTYSVNGQQVPRTQAVGKLEGLTDDRHKLRVTIIGSDEQRAKVRRELESNPRFQESAEAFTVRDYPPNHWSLQPGFVTSGQPTVYCQAPTGKVLHRQDDAKGGTEALVGALRKAKDSYDPKKDPDMRTQSQPSPAVSLSFPSLLFALMVGSGFALVGRRFQDHRQERG